MWIQLVKVGDWRGDRCGGIVVAHPIGLYTPRTTDI